MPCSAQPRWVHRHAPFRIPTRSFKGADSRVLLRHVVGLIHVKGWKVGNVDNTIVAQAPKMAPHIETMRAPIAADLQVELDQVNVKATTTSSGLPVAKRALPCTPLPCCCAHE